MTGSGSPCGACKFLRRKCVKGCVFAPYFCHEEGATHFAAIHKVFGASNASKLLSHLPVNERCEAALTISYEAQARVRDPIYGCVSHIFALQQQVVSLQAQLASLKEQAAQSMNVHGNYTAANPSFEKCNAKLPSQVTQDLQSWFHQANPQFNQNFSDDTMNLPSYNNTNNLQSYTENSGITSREDQASLCSSGQESSNYSMMSSYVMQQQAYNSQWRILEDSDHDHDFQSAMFGYIQR